MKSIKKIVLWFVVILLITNVVLLLTGKSYIYKAIASTYMAGKQGPSIDDYLIFENRKVADSIPQDWPLGKDYNRRKIPERFMHDFTAYDPVAFLIIQKDSIRYEQYWNGYDSNSFSNSFSIAKTITSILTGIAIKEGKIKSVDQLVADFIPEFKTGKRSGITIRHLLTMSSGIDFDENYNNPFAYPAAAYYGGELEKLTLKYDASEDAGKVMRYLSGNSQLLGMVLTEATGKSLSDYASEKLWKPIGATNPAFWSLDRPNGIEKAYCCFNSNARDFARIAKLYLHKGNWNGTQIVPEQYVLESVQPATLLEKDGSKNDQYGYSWWLVNYKNHAVFYARGILGQYVLAIPDKDLIVVRLGHKRDPASVENHPKDMFTYLDIALDMYQAER